MAAVENLSHFLVGMRKIHKRFDAVGWVTGRHRCNYLQQFPEVRFCEYCLIWSNSGNNARLSKNGKLWKKNLVVLWENWSIYCDPKTSESDQLFEIVSPQFTVFCVRINSFCLFSGYCSMTKPNIIREI